MSISTFHFNALCMIVVLLAVSSAAHAQADTAQQAKTKFIQRVSVDSAKPKLNMDAVYNRPFLALGKSPVAVGGYMEINTQYAVTDGVDDGFSFQFRRMTVFLASTIAKKIKFLSEIEFEEGGKEINIEFASIDFELHPLVNLRGGIVMNPIGAFNQNHDGPRWDFTDRPLSSTTILPATLSNAGMGIYGKHFYGNWIFGYEAYLTNGLDDKVIANDQNRTSLAAGKSNPEKFEESNSGLPMFTGKVAIRNRRMGEVGLSFMRGVYNKWKDDGLVFDQKRSVTALAFDFNTALLHNRLNILGEAAQVLVDVPSGYSQQFGSKQFGAFADIIGTVLHRRVLGWDHAKLEIGIRLEYVDYNIGTFRGTDMNIGDHLWSVYPCVAFRPAGTTVIRFNYRWLQQTDITGNLPSKTGAVQLGFSTYF